tara:strand:- start:61 stop:459 length:399 start_codon:yes stop_codon:yes gene_type:complete
MGVTDNFDEFVAMYHHKKTDIDMYEALRYILNSENIYNKKALDKYCKNVGRKMLEHKTNNKWRSNEYNKLYPLDNYQRYGLESVGRKNLYDRIQNISQTHWNKIKNPESAIYHILFEYYTKKIGYDKIMKKI